MFKKLAVFTDIHFGLKSNSKLHNDDCEEFIDWYIDLAKQHGCETGMFCGDWHHNRNSVNITTMDASIRSLEKIGKAFDKFISFQAITIYITRTAEIFSQLNSEDLFQASQW